MKKNGDLFVLGRRVDLIFRNLYLGQSVSIAVASGLVWIASTAIAPAPLWTWWIVAVLAALYRMLQARRYFSQPAAVRATDCVAWRQRALAGVMLSGIIWASGAVLLSSAGEVTLQLFTALTMIGMTAGAVPILAADRIIFRVYAWPIIGAVIACGMGSSRLQIALTVTITFALTLFTRSADKFSETLGETFRLEYEKGEMLTKIDESRRMAEQADRAKTEFLANISHELRTPMNGIIGLAELLDHENLTADQQSLLDPLRASANDLMRQIDLLIQLSALEAGHIKNRPAPFAVVDLLEGLLSSQRKAAIAKGLALHQQANPKLPQVLVGDLDHLRQIFDHLVGNAIKFTERGSISITARPVDRQDDKTWIEFCVTDTGPGIAPETLPSLNGLLTQGDGSSMRRHGGIGVGLPIVRKLIEVMDGSLQIDSQVGQGSQFCFTLPFGQPAPDDVL